MNICPHLWHLVLIQTSNRPSSSSIYDMLILDSTSSRNLRLPFSVAMICSEPQKRQSNAACPSLESSRFHGGRRRRRMLLDVYSQSQTTSRCVRDVKRRRRAALFWSRWLMASAVVSTRSSLCSSRRALGQTRARDTSCTRLAAKSLYIRRRTS